MKQELVKVPEINPQKVMTAKRGASINDGIKFLTTMDLKGRNLTMPGEGGRYQPKELKPYLGYDQWAGWLILVEWAWLETLAQMSLEGMYDRPQDRMPDSTIALLTPELLHLLLKSITTKMMDDKEKGIGAYQGEGTGHDINALLFLMDQLLPEPLRRWRHFAATSYDKICCAYALQYQACFLDVVYPKMQQVSYHWRMAIGEHTDTPQTGRTHLMNALPITFGFWLAERHNRFASNCGRAQDMAFLVEGKFSGAVGTRAAQLELLSTTEGEDMVLSRLGLVKCPISTQIVQPESLGRAYHELVYTSISLGNLGDDARQLQSSAYRELESVGSKSSTMSHKRSNPVTAENMYGMHRIMVGEYTKLLMNGISDFGRDISGSCVMRGYSAMIVYLYQQLQNTERWFKNLRVDPDRCLRNLLEDAKVMPAELLHLALQRNGLPDAHKFVNEQVVPRALLDNSSLGTAAELFKPGISANLPENILRIMENPTEYIGDAVILAANEMENAL
ncbi:hypothetical protein HGA34_03120 [Candidatus Falkowbacteria bacterium]|nr:hypothetical protein [Candidatus Falkowbacteria bacterium]